MNTKPVLTPDCIYPAANLNNSALQMAQRPQAIKFKIFKIIVCDLNGERITQVEPGVSAPATYICNRAADMLKTTGQ